MSLFLVDLQITFFQLFLLPKFWMNESENSAEDPVAVGALFFPLLFSGTSV